MFERKVPDVATPRCRCGEAPETAAHLALDCGDLVQQREELRRLMAPKAMRTYRDFATATATKKSARALIRWLLSTGRFPEFRLAERYKAEADQEYQEWVEAAARQRLAGVPRASSSLPVSPG